MTFVLKPTTESRQRRKEFDWIDLISSPLRNRMRSPGFRPALSAALPAQQNESKQDDVCSLMHLETSVWLDVGFTGDDRVDPHRRVTPESEAKAHVAFAHSHRPKKKNNDWDAPATDVTWKWARLRGLRLICNYHNGHKDAAVMYSKRNVQYSVSSLLII